MRLINLLSVLLCVFSYGFEWRANFENDKIGLYSKTEWKKDFPNATGYTSSGIKQKRVCVKKLRTKNLCVIYQKNLSHTGGAKWRMKIPPSNEASLSYEVYFQKGFLFKKGGKLPGLAGGVGQVGGKNSKNGFSVRIMWYSSGTKKSVKNQKFADLYAYLYFPSKKRKYGLPVPLNFEITSGKWYKIKIFVRLNDPGKKNGILKIWINDERVLLLKNFVYRINDIKINQFLFHTFFGGHTKPWASPKTQYSCFDDFEISY
jgi:hypothetical protein